MFCGSFDDCILAEPSCTLFLYMCFKKYVSLLHFESHPLSHLLQIEILIICVEMYSYCLFISSNY